MEYEVPEIGWLAAKCMPFGTQTALAVLGMAITLDSGNASDDMINEMYAELANTDDTVWAVNTHYRTLEEEHPFLTGFLGSITRWTEEPSHQHYDAVRDLAGLVRKVKWSMVEPKAGGDVLGSVYNRMMAIGGRRTAVHDYVPRDAAYMEWMMRFFPKPIRNITDVWCGSGTRALGAWKYQLFVDGPTDIPVVLNDPGPAAIAMAGLNVVGAGIGPNVTLHCDKGWAEQWGYATFYGAAPALRRKLPPELSEDAKIRPLKPMDPIVDIALGRFDDD